MRINLIAAALLAGLALSAPLLFGSGSTHKKSTGKTSTHKSTASTPKKSAAKTSSHKSKASHKSVSATSKSTHSAHGKKTKQAARQPKQAAPSPERYKEIQQALADRGYYKGSVDGSWNADSVDALKRFEQDQHLTPDGKISSLALIGLGLGPKHEPIGDYAAKPASEPPSNP